jgi:peptide/nickel transport system substrate-binding protein
MNRRIAAGAVGAGLFLSACTQFGSAGGSAVLTIAVQADVTGIYPAIRNESFTYTVNANVFEGLTAFGRGLELVPALADRWENSAEDTWVFHLRSGVHFSDGQPVRTRDVVASLRYAMGSDTTKTLLAPIQSVESVSEELIQVRTRFPCPVLLANLTFAFVLPEAALRMEHVPPIGTGPFKVERWSPGQVLVLEQNPHFRGPPPPFKRALFVVIPDPVARLDALDAGRVDIVEDIPLSEIREVRRREGLQVVSRPGLRVLFLAFRMDRPPFSSAAVREAVDLALDRNELVQRALRGYGAPAAELVPVTVFGYNPGLHVTIPDRKRAQERLRSAGYPKGFKVRLDGPSDRYAGGVDIMREVARQLLEVGITVELNAIPKERFFELADSGRYQLLLYGWSCETAQAGEALDELIRTPAAGAPPNLEFLSDAKLDRLIDEANRSPRLEGRSDRLSEALARVAEIRPILPLVIQHESFAFSRRVEWEPSLDMALHLADIRRKNARIGD